MREVAQLLGPEIEQEAQAIADLADQLQQDWTAAADLRVNTKGWIYDLHPYLFRPAFGRVEDSDLRRLALAGRFLANAVVLLDMQIDEPVDDATTAGWALRATALQFEAYRLLQALFPLESEFWPAFRTSISDFIAAYTLEQDFAAGKRPWHAFGPTAAISIATGKTAMARGSVYGLAGLSRDSGPVSDLVRSIDEYNIARQIFDDVHDWKTDLAERRPSIVLRELLPEELPGAEQLSAPGFIEQLARRLYYEDVLDAMMDRVLLHAGRALDASAAWPNLPWRTVIRMLERGARELQGDTRRITAENRERVRKVSAVSVQLPEPRTDWEAILCSSLGFVIDQWRVGFGEARAIGYFSRAAGFTSDEYQSGDVFQRALIADTLLDAGSIVGDQLRPLVDSEVEYLLTRRSADGLGWSFYPRLKELPNDADDVAQVMQVLLRSGRRDAVAAYCAVAIDAVLRNQRSDGSFETWIVPAPGERQEVHQLQLAFVERAWGRGADPDVVANFLYALGLYDADRYADEIRSGSRWVVDQQQPDGTWRSTWYDGPYYGCYVSARLLAQVGEVRALDRMARALGARQNGDGGWGTGSTSDPLSTALAVLALAQAGMPAESPEFTAARGYLATGLEAGWPSIRFIQMDMNRAGRRSPQMIYYGSRTLTTAFVCKAATAAVRVGGAPDRVAVS